MLEDAVIDAGVSIVTKKKGQDDQKETETTGLPLKMVLEKSKNTMYNERM